MDLLDRYLAAIARELPKRQARDIIAELRDTLLSQIEEKEEAFGRPLTEPELEVVLHDFGHPLVVASRYRGAQQLIGPELFPFWWATLRTVLAIAVAVWIARIVLNSAFGRSAVVIAGALPNLLTSGLFVFGVVTLLFVVIERAGGAKALRRWNPAHLPPAGLSRRPRLEIVGEFAMAGVFLLWWTGLIHFSNFLPYTGGMRVDLAPVWAELYWAILAAAMADIVVNAIELARPGWGRVNAGLSLARNIAGCAIVVYALQAGHWIVVTAPALPPEVLPNVQANFDLGMKIGLIVTAGLFGSKAFRDVWRFVRAAGALAARRAGVSDGAHSPV
jgi:hypothetical protein